MWCRSVVQRKWPRIVREPERSAPVGSLPLAKNAQHSTSIERASFVLRCELWTENFDSMLALVKEYIHNRFVGG